MLSSLKCSEYVLAFYPKYKIINVEKLTYADNLMSFKDVEDKSNYTFIKADICNFAKMYALMQDLLRNITWLMGKISSMK